VSKNVDRFLTEGLDVVLGAETEDAGNQSEAVDAGVWADSVEIPELGRILAVSKLRRVPYREGRILLLIDSRDRKLCQVGRP
jgi:hypothetical protein